MPSNERERISEIIREQIDSFEFRRPYIIKGNESLISNEISYDQAVNDAIHDFIENLTEFGMAAHYVDITSRGIHIRHINPNAIHAVMPAVIGGLKHDIIIADEIESKENIFSINRNQYQKCNSSEKRMKRINEDFFKEKIKKNHPHGWYRKFEKKGFKND